jgi:hypothetical protein
MSQNGDGGINNSSAGLYNLSFPAGEVLFPAPFNNIQVGDTVLCSTVPGGFTCTNVAPFTDSAGKQWVVVYLSGFIWPAIPVSQMGVAQGDYAAYLTSNATETSTFTRLPSSTSVQGNYVVAQSVTASTSNNEVRVIPLTFVTGLVPGDVLEFVPTPTRPQGASFTIADVDSILNNIITVDPVAINLQGNDPLIFSSKTMGQMVFTSFADVLVKANTLGGTDLSRFNAMVAPDPVLTWIAPRATYGYTSVIYCPNNIVPNLTGIDIATANGAMLSGTPEGGWSGSPRFVQNVDWTRQLTKPPSSLMLDQTALLAPNAWPNNRNGTLENSPNYALTEAQTAFNGTALQTIVHDYPGRRRIVTSLVGSAVFAKQYTWSGGAWSAASPLDWDGPPPNCGIPFPPVAGLLGSGSAILYLDNTNVLRLMYGLCPGSLTLSRAQAGGLLVSTPYGCYLVSQNGYGLITWTGNNLSLNWQPLKTAGIWLLPTTFVAMDKHNVYCLVAVQEWDSASAAYTYSTYLYHLAAVPIPPAASSPGVSIVGMVQGDCLTVSETGGRIQSNQILTVNNATTPNTVFIVSQTGGTPGGPGTYQLSQAIDSLPSQTMNLSFGGAYPSILEKPELICGSIPSVIMAAKDPSSARIFGLCGSRMFQISRVASGVIERFCVDGMTCQQLIEYVAMIQNAYVCPLADGHLHIISRNLQETAIDLAVTILSCKEYLASEYFISQVNVSGAGDNIYAEQAGLMGGLTLEIDNPFLTTVSQCRAVAASYLAFFGSGRPSVELEVTYTGTGIPPWESLLPSQTVTVNGGTTEYYVLGLEYSLMDYKATLKLLQK